MTLWSPLPVARRLVLSAAVLSASMLTGCAAPPPAAPLDTSVFNDALFDAPAQQPDVSRLFEMTPSMRTHLVERIAPQVWRKGPQMALLDALYTEGDLRLEYDSVHTRTAAEAFEARKGNCLSLVIMTAAFAREMGLSVRFNEVLDRPVLEDSGALTFVIGHVNLALGDVGRVARPGLADRNWLLVDFVPGHDLRQQHVRELDERRIKAQFMNNRAAEELALGRVHDAYWWVRGALAQDPGFANLYNTLGVIYRHRGAPDQAQRAWQLAQAMDPGNEHVARNVAAAHQPHSPLLANKVPSTKRFWAVRQALDEGRVEQAQQMLQGELGLTPRNAEAHHLLAITHARLGHVEQARVHLAKAADFSADGAQRQLYAAKLQSLRAKAAQQPVLQ